MSMHKIEPHNDARIDPQDALPGASIDNFAGLSHPNDMIESHSLPIQNIPVTDQRSVSLIGWSCAVVFGVLCWIGLAKLVGLIA